MTCSKVRASSITAWPEHGGGAATEQSQKCASKAMEGSADGMQRIKPHELCPRRA